MIYLKNKSDIESMRKSGDILIEVLEKLKSLVSIGVTTLELDRVAEQLIRSKGAIPSFKGYQMAGAVDFPGSVCASINEEVVHGIPNNRSLKDGDILSIDVGVFFDGFHTDAARTWQVGNVSEEAKTLIKITKESFFKGIEMAVKGKRICDISAAIEDHVNPYGFGIVMDLTGHGIGRNLHEDPSIPNYRGYGRGPRLEPGMALAIEPMINIGTHRVKTLGNKWTIVTADGSLSAHYENTIIVTDGEPLILTKA